MRRMLIGNVQSKKVRLVLLGTGCDKNYLAMNRGDLYAEEVSHGKRDIIRGI